MFIAMENTRGISFLSWEEKERNGGRIAKISLDRLFYNARPSHRRDSCRCSCVYVIRYIHISTYIETSQGSVVECPRNVRNLSFVRNCERELIGGRI